jgi:hypothetical protein
LPTGDDQISYAEFGERFFERAVTEGRIVGALDGLAGDQIEFGPKGADRESSRRCAQRNVRPGIG